MKVKEVLTKQARKGKNSDSWKDEGRRREKERGREGSKQRKREKDTEKSDTILSFLSI